MKKRKWFAVTCLILAFSIALCACSITVSTGSASKEKPSATEVTEQPTETIPDDGAVHVSTVDEFLAAIAPNTEIVLAPGEYNLMSSKAFGRIGGEWYHWESVFDGSELIITDVTGLTIRGEENGAVMICTEPRYANVMSFQNVSDLTISGLTLGHTKEKGSCSGGVLNLQNCERVEIDNTKLYGCGTLGVECYSCKDVHVDCSDVYECSEGCVVVEGSYNVLFENSKFYRCSLWSSVFRVSASYQVAFINSEVFQNYGVYGGSLIHSDSAGVYLGGLDVHDNVFRDAIFDFEMFPATVEKCRFLESALWSTGVFPVSADGTELTEADLRDMSMRTVQWTSAELPVFTAPEESEDGKIHVSTVDEFLAALGHDRTIYIEPGTYNLADAEYYGSLGGDFYQWEHTFDGPQLVISGVKGLTIEGAGKDDTAIVATPRYANVLTFQRCTNLIVRDLTAGHTEAPGECSGGVIMLDASSNTNIEGCGLFGCGIIGVNAFNCRLLNITNCEIYDCSYSGISLYECRDVNVNFCDFHDNGGPDYYVDNWSENAFVDGNLMEKSEW